MKLIKITDAAEKKLRDDYNISEDYECQSFPKPKYRVFVRFVRGLMVHSEFLINCRTKTLKQVI